MTNYDLEINRGSSYSVSITATNSDGTALNLSGYNLRGYLRPYYSATGYHVFSGIISSEISGISTLSLTSIQTANLPIGYMVYDVEVYTTGISGVDNNVTKILKGYAKVYPETTR